ncbi:TPA: class I SAM-dependent methyltransferase [Candidatus Woesearchaeota archaeon]|nr:class I SAM-dependent methyltransferase [Candidatus Woesearchaeota archaeon]
MEKSKSYENKIQHTKKVYEKTAEHYDSIRRDVSEMKDLTDFFISHLKGNKILDIGCAGGRDAEYFHDQGFDVTGIDFTEKFIEIAEKIVPKAKFIEMDMRDLNFKDEEFDGIWCCAAFLHIPKSQAGKTLEGFRRVLKNRGLLYLCVKQGQGEKMVSKAEYLGNAKFYAFYQEDEFKKLIQNAGFSIIKSSVNERKDNIWINVFALKQ